MPTHPWLADPDLIVDEIMAHQADLYDRTAYKTSFERTDLRQRIATLQRHLRDALALQKPCSK